MSPTDLYEYLLGAPDVLVAGVDEAGRGPLAGPVFGAAVILDCGVPPPVALNDSKRMTQAQRNDVYGWICSYAKTFAIGIVSAQDVDRHNVLEASMMAMKKAIDGLSATPEAILVDGLHTPKGISSDCYHLVRGDQRSYSVSAASVLAKVERDRFMTLMDHYYPGYEFARHKGYPSFVHRKALAQLGICPLHRRSFKGVDSG